jgi:hypothetical protein
MRSMRSLRGGTVTVYFFGAISNYKVQGIWQPIPTLFCPVSILTRSVRSMRSMRTMRSVRSMHSVRAMRWDLSNKL